MSTETGQAAPEGDEKPSRIKTLALGFLRFVVVLVLLVPMFTFTLYLDWGQTSVDQLQVARVFFDPDLDLGRTQSALIPEGVAGSPVLALLVPLVMLGVLSLRRWWGVAAGSVVIAGLYAVFAPQEHLVTAAYTIGAKVAFLWFLLYGRLLGRSFLVFPAGAVAYVALAMGIRAERYGLETVIQERGHAIGLLLYCVGAFLVFALVTVVLRFVARVIRDNWYTVAVMGPQQMLRTAGVALLYWGFLFVFAIPAFLFQSTVSRSVEDGLYESGLVYTADQLAEVGAQPARYFPRTLNGVLGSSRQEQALKKYYRRMGGGTQSNVRGSIAHRYNRIFFDFQENLSEIGQQLVEESSVGRGALEEAAGEAFDAAVPTSLDMAAYAGGGWLEGLAEPVVNWILDRIEAAYVRTRQQARLGVITRVAGLEEELSSRGLDSAEAAAAVEAIMQAELVRANQRMQDVVSRLFFWVNVWSVVSPAVFVFFCVRSYMYVFARVAFAQATGAVVAITEAALSSDSPAGLIHQRGSALQIPAGEGQTYYFSRRFEPHGMPPDFAVPQPFTNIIRRLVSGTWAMNRIQAGEEGVYFTAIQGSQFVEWELAEGETVIFDWTSFAGVSEDAVLSTVISLRASSLLLGNLIFPAVTGPGRLILWTVGRAQCGDDPQTRVSMPSERLIAWNQDMNFTVAATPGLVNTYMSGAYIQRAGAGNLVLDADRQGDAKRGLTRFIRHFLWPV